MRRTRTTGPAARSLLGGLLLAGLLLGGCARHADTPTQDPAPAATSVKTPAQAKPAASDDVDDLLREVDKQISGDEQPAEDQD